MPLSILAGTTAPSGPTVALQLPFSWTASLVYPWGSQTANATVTTPVNEQARVTWAVI